MVIFVMLNLTYNSDLNDKNEVFNTFSLLYVEDLCKTLS